MEKLFSIVKDFITLFGFEEIEASIMKKNSIFPSKWDVLHVFYVKDTSLYVSFLIDGCKKFKIVLSSHPNKKFSIKNILIYGTEESLLLFIRTLPYSVAHFLLNRDLCHEIRAKFNSNQPKPKDIVVWYCSKRQTEEEQRYFLEESVPLNILDFHYEHEKYDNLLSLLSLDVRIYLETKFIASQINADRFFNHVFEKSRYDENDKMLYPLSRMEFENIKQKTKKTHKN